MHEDFGEWYRLVSIDPTGEMLQKRWAGVTDWCKEHENSIEEILEVARIFCGLGQVDSDAREGFGAAFLKHDSAFPRRNELELRVLAGTALHQLIAKATSDGDGEGGVLAGTALVSSARRPSSEQRLTELAGACTKLLEQLANAKRVRGGVETALISTTKVKPHIEAAQGATDHNQLKAAVVPLLTQFLKAIQQAEVSLEAARNALECADEELNILWWLEGACSRDGGCLWTSLKKEAVPIMSGKELADLTTILPGHTQAKSLLQKTVSDAKCKAATLQSVVNALPDNWVTKVAEGLRNNPALDLAPICTAITCRSRGDANWVGPFEKSTGLNAKVSWEAAELALQVYAELLLLRAAAGGES